MMQSRNTTGRASRFRTRAVSLAAIAATALSVACSDAPSAPGAAAAARPSMGLVGTVTDGLNGIVTVLTAPLEAKVLQRKSPIATESATVVVGSSGATLVLAKAGLTVAIPFGAVAAGTRITVTAPAGRGVWYEFAPHGLEFARPLQVTQDLRGTNYGALLSPPLKAGYYMDGSLNEKSGTALVTELISTVVSPFGTKVSFPVQHFSGYMIAWGSSDEM